MHTPTPASPLRALLRYAQSSRRTVLAAIGCSVLNKLFDLAPPVLIGLAVDVVVEKEASFLAGWGLESLTSQLVALAVLTVLVWGLESIFEYLYQLLWRGLAQQLQHDLRLDAYQHVQRLDRTFFQERSIGGLMAVLNDDVNQLERFLDGGANAILQIITTMIAVSLTFFALSPGVAALAMIPIPLIVWGSFRFQARIAPLYLRVREASARLNGQLANNLAGIETIKSFTAEAHESSRIEVQSAAYRSANEAAIKLSSAFVPLIRMAIVLGFTATLIYGGHLAGTGEMAVGAYSVLVFLTQRLLWPLTRLGNTLDQYQRAMASTRRILELLQTHTQIVGGTVIPERIEGAIRFESIAFAYPNRPQLLTRFHLGIQAGQTVAIVGPTGSGKSTLVRLLLRLHDPQSGSVTLDGQDIAQIDLPTLRGAIGLVSQHVFLFPGTVRENIEYGRRGADDAAIEQAARVAEAHGFISALPNGYDTLVGEGGRALSGGQRQRLSIARALLKDPPILVLDEATSAVDNETEAAIQRALVHVTEGRTTLIIAHRLSTIRRADQIIVMEAGAITEQGTHEGLVAQGGTYARLWAVQTGGGAP
jgi:ATP-binding cassette subfamily B protein